jgi:hypothetical protein
MTFQLKSKNVFLTYAQFDTSKEELLEHLKTLCPTASIVVGHELHEDGGHHLHAYIQAAESIRTRDVAFFDYNGKHPNIQSSRSASKTYKYVTKDGDTVTHGEFTFGTGTSWADAAAATDAKTFKDIIKTNCPRDYILNYDKVENYARLHFAFAKTPYANPYNAEDFNPTEKMMDFVIQMDEVSKTPFCLQEA